ncbi:hypothetical protein M378DRAFT_530018 [Amanita muscaria Koide BX008]|uniref:Uncharacterized protein n=1 Tax=Amanita muscaria (strain Koide BX008) TaxID=946122 RepID=A0A0C2WUL4_AMAMK|nr:hypothetical protein M378DRAFT_530018 [Amanita muscaria Koide BX008]
MEPRWQHRQRCERSRGHCQDHRGQQVAGETTEEGLPQQQQAVLLEQRRLNLQRLHDKLYRGRYLTPQDFQPRFCETQRRGLTKTSTGCIKRRLEFDPTLGMGCQCMAVQERKRREAHREANREGRRGATAAAAKREWERHDDKAQCKGKQVGA